MRPGIRRGLVIVLVAFVGAGAWTLQHRTAESTTSKARTSATPSAFAWKRGTRAVYDFEWSNRSLTQMGGASINATSKLTGQLAFTCYGRRGDTWLLGVTVPTVHEAKLNAMSNDLFEEPAVVHETFDGREALVELGPRGEVVKLHFRESDPPLFKQLLQSIVGESQVVLSGTPNVREWRTAEVLSVGKLEMAYAVDANESLLLHRTPAHLLSAAAVPPGVAQGITAVLGGAGDVHLDREGFVRTIASRLDVTMSGALEHHTVFAMTLATMTEVTVPERVETESSMQSVVPGAAPQAPDLRQRMDERFATRSSEEQIKQLIAAQGTGLPPARGAITAAAAFLRLHPEACADIGALFLDPEMSSASREFTMGLLSSAGSPAAQSAMRRGLDIPESRAEVGTFGRMVQRMGFVTEPTRETLDYLVALYDSPAVTTNADLRRVTGLTLGAISHHAARTHSALADAIHARLVGGLERAKDTDERVGLVAAVGNAARPGDVPLLRVTAKDNEPRVREAVARALRSTDSPETRSTLRDMFTDPSADVASAAARSYNARTLTSADMTEVATLVTSGTTNPGADGTMLMLVQGHMDDKESSERILEALLARHPNGETSGQIRLLLRRLRGEG